MIKILYLHAGAEMYGADKVLLDLVTNLDRTRFSPIVVLPEYGILFDEMSRVADTRVIEYPILRRKYFNPIGIIQYGLSYFKKSKALRQIIEKENVDLIHTNTSAVLEGMYLKKRTKARHIWHIHEILVKPRFMHKLTSKLIAKHSDEVTAVSNAVKNHLNQTGYFKKDINVIYNGVDSNCYFPENDKNTIFSEYNLPDDALLIGMAGRYNAWKGQHYFLKAANIAMANDKRLYTVFVGNAYKGEEQLEVDLNNEIENSPYKDRIINLGFRTDLKNIYPHLDIFVLPSTNPDPLPTVVLEAMACAKPVVAYRHGGVCEMVQENVNGLFANVCSPEDLAEKITVLIKNDELRKKMGENSRERLLNHFSIKAYVDNFSKLYENTHVKS